jgi:hypothetical protein
MMGSNMSLVAFTRKACPALGRGAPLLFSLMKKVTKKSSQQRGFFALKAFARQN